MAAEVPVPRLGKKRLSQMLSLKVTKAPIYLTPGTEQETDKMNLEHLSVPLSKKTMKSSEAGSKDSGDKAETTIGQRWDNLNMKTILQNFHGMK